MVSELSALANRNLVVKQTTGRPFSPYLPSALTENLKRSATNDEKSAKKNLMSFFKAVQQQPNCPNSGSVSTAVKASSSGIKHIKPKPIETEYIFADKDWSVYRS